MKKLAALLLLGMVSFATQAFPQTPAQSPAHPKKPAAPKAGAASKAGAAAAGSYDRVLLRPALLKDKAPDTFQVKFDTTRGEFTVTVTRAWAPLGADRFYN